VRLSCVILTMGDRPRELRRAIDSVLGQQGEPVELVVVGNGADPGPVPAGVTVVRLDENVGIPAGRNAGVQASHGEVVLFLDDDGWYPSTMLASHVRQRFVAQPPLAVLSFRVTDLDGGAAQRRHVPRLRAADPGRSSAVTTFLGGACAIRRRVFDEVGPLPGEFFFGHEETDFAWRALDAGYRIEYDADAVMGHPAAPPSRHEHFYRLNARNRVWLARRRLPWPLAFVYLVDWVLITVVRVRSGSALRTWFGGFAAGWREPAGERRPMRWRTALAMLRAGRPPIV
jgi:GT2 family glycosyltransferase